MVKKFASIEHPEKSDAARELRDAFEACWDLAKLATLLYWKKTANDSRDTASDVGEYIIAQSKALKFAQAIENGELHERWPSGFRPGFGITIKYGSGRLRNVKAQY